MLHEKKAQSPIRPGSSRNFLGLSQAKLQFFWLKPSQANFNFRKPSLSQAGLIASQVKPSYFSKINLNSIFKRKF